MWRILLQKSKIKQTRNSQVLWMQARHTQIQKNHRPQKIISAPRYKASPWCLRGWNRLSKLFSQLFSQLFNRSRDILNPRFHQDLWLSPADLKWTIQASNRFLKNGPFGVVANPGANQPWLGLGCPVASECAFAECWDLIDWHLQQPPMLLLRSSLVKLSRLDMKADLDCNAPKYSVLGEWLPSSQSSQIRT